MASLPLSKKIYASALKAIGAVWGRVNDRADAWGVTTPPQTNPDETSNERQFDAAHNPFCVSGMIYRDISSLFVSARGLTPEKNGTFTPAQLIYTTPDDGDPDILKMLAWQYDEGFEPQHPGEAGGFPSILKSLDDPCKTYGRAVAEIDWYVREEEPYKGNVFARFIWSRDPEEYFFDIDGKPGIYREKTYDSYERMDDMRFMAYAYEPLYNNPYGENINSPLLRMLESWVKEWGYWENLLQKGGMGSWIGYYDNDLKGNSTEAKNKRAAFIAQIKALAAGTASIAHKNTTIEQQKLQTEAQAFLDKHNAVVEAISILYTGSATALKEGKHGSYAKEEATTVREKQAREIMDAVRVCSFWTYQFNRRFVDLNFAPIRIKIYPTLQLISPIVIGPTTPEGQKTEEQETQQTQERQAQPPPKEKLEESELMSRQVVQELQEDDEPLEPPPAVGPYDKDFPQSSLEPPLYMSNAERAKQFLASLPAAPYETVTAEQAPRTFTVKRLRVYAPKDEEIIPLLKDAITPTLDLKSEAEAWLAYYPKAIEIFTGYNIPMSPKLRNDLHVSFRQARRNAFEGALDEMAAEDDSIVAFRIVANNPNTRFIHGLWHGVTLAKDDPLWETVRPPSDFMCDCHREAVSDAARITNKADLPKVLPGDTYRFYAPRVR